MRRPPSIPRAVGCLLLLLAASPSRADPIIAWDQSWRAPTQVMADNGLGGVFFSPSAGPQTLSGSTQIIATSLQPVYSPLLWTPPWPGPGPWPNPLPGASPLPGPVPGPGVVLGPPAMDPARFDHASFRLIQFIRDEESGVTGSLTFSGDISGTFSPQNAGLTVRITSPLSQTLHLGHHLYTVTIDQITQPGLPGDPPGSISAHVTVKHNPEPSSLVLAALGVPGLGLTYWRRRRARRQAATPA